MSAEKQQDSETAAAPLGRERLARLQALQARVKAAEAHHKALFAAYDADPTDGNLGAAISANVDLGEAEERYRYALQKDSSALLDMAESSQRLEERVRELEGENAGLRERVARWEPKPDALESVSLNAPGEASRD